jgi:hypothetical protein
MPKSKESNPPTKKAAWKTDSYDGALLFLLLHKRVAGTQMISVPLKSNKTPSLSLISTLLKHLKGTARQLLTRSKSLKKMALD